MTTEAAYQELLTISREASLLGSCGALLGWDERTYLPPKGAEFRGDQMALLARLTHEMNTSPKIGDLLGTLEAAGWNKHDDAVIAGNIREIRRGYNRAVKLPKSLVEELARITTRSQGVWQEARRTNDFPAFRPWLEQIVSLKKQEADAVGYIAHPYNALLDEYEPGATAAGVTTIFAGLAKELVPLIEAIRNSSMKANPEILSGDFPVNLQETFSREAATAIGFDFEAGRLDTTTHPFCSGIGPGDCRITTRYNPRFFNEALFGVLHEAGHGIYEQGLKAEAFGTPAGSFCSLGIHESQSRFWENQVGRSPEFWEHWFPKAKEVFPTALKDVRPESFHLAINEVKPSFIRVEADEATYNLHIILRFELERDLLTGQLPVADLPAAWNERFRAMFGLTPPDDRLGCLQDIHWSMGGIGYFPTYTLGNLYAAQFMQRVRTDFPTLDDDFRKGNYLELKGWLNREIHRHGRTYLPGDLCERITGQSLSFMPFVEYLREKMGRMYRLS
ncbi:carboxypeptidase M32 [Zavarzinella formosa]|uniref:carboxypeptidase M32 n=1 Tax=Zavarzinella formosa TaxID=360055 RepID=UPI000311383A|nr:carboxypeptidase M32 [Zavarzinella formosa]